MPLCIKFVDEDRCIEEEFVQFSTLVRVIGELIAAQICSDLKNLELDVKNIRGRGYDDASDMSSDHTGVQAHIRKNSPLTVYTRCSGHCFNLVITHSSGLHVISNVLVKMKANLSTFLE